MAKFSFGGLPTGPSVDMIMDAIGVPVKGQTIPYTEIEVAADLSYRSYRWTTVTNAWRKRIERDYGLVITCIPGAFYVNDDAGLVVQSRGHLRTAVKKTKRSYVVVSLAERENLTPEDRNRADLQRRLAPQLPAPKVLGK